MLFKLSSTSGSKIFKDRVQSEEALSYLQSALFEKKTRGIAVGILFCREFSGSLCSGTSSDGATWGFSIFSNLGTYKQECQKAFVHQGKEYDILRASIDVSFYDLILHHRLESCGCDSYRIDVCLPQEMCARINSITCLERSAKKESLIFEFTKELAEQIRQKNEILHTVLPEGAQVVH